MATQGLDLVAEGFVLALSVLWLVWTGRLIYIVFGRSRPRGLPFRGNFRLTSADVRMLKGLHIRP